MRFAALILVSFVLTGALAAPVASACDAIACVRPLLRPIVDIYVHVMGEAKENYHALEAGADCAQATNATCTIEALPEPPETGGAPVSLWSRFVAWFI